MKKVVIYRDKITNKICCHHNINEGTQDAVKKYNSIDTNKYIVEIIQLDEISEYFYNCVEKYRRENI